MEQAGALKLCLGVLGSVRDRQGISRYSIARLCPPSLCERYVARCAHAQPDPCRLRTVYAVHSLGLARLSPGLIPSDG